MFYRFRSGLLLSGALLLWAGAAFSACAAPAPDRSDSIPFPDGVADAAGKVAFIANATGGIDAVDLAKGELLWDSKEASKPLALSGDNLLAQIGVKDKANQARIVVLDVTRRGKKVSESEAIVLPDWVSLGKHHGRSFFSTGRMVKRDLLYYWNADAWYAGGAAPPEILERLKKDQSGVARVNVETGKVEMLANDDVPNIDPKLPKELEKVASRQYWTGTHWLTNPLIAGEKVAALSMTQDGDKQTLTLKRWEQATGKELKDTELLQGKALWPQVTLDGKHLLVHQALVKEELPEGDYAWWLFSLESGERIAKVPHVDLQNPVVFGPRVCFTENKPMKVLDAGGEQERLLRVMDLKTGKIEWERPVASIWVLPRLR
jgi:hypothetical protein